MIPIGDQNIRSRGRPWVTWLLIAVNVVVFIYELTLGPGQLEAFATQYGAVPQQILQGENLLSLLTSMFLHGGWVHVISNMLFLGVFGDNVEAVLGKLRYLIFYLGGGLAASAAQILLNPASQQPIVGASGAVAAALGAYVVMFPRSQVRVLVFFGYFAPTTRVAAFLFIGIWFVTQLLSGVASLGVNTAQTGGVAYWAHVGGLVAGAVVGFIFRSRARELVPQRRA